MAFKKPTFKTERPVCAYDIEVAANYFFIGLRTRDGRTIGYERSDRSDFDPVRVRQVMNKYTFIGFNSRDYDAMMLFAALDGYTNQQLVELSDDIIGHRLKPWDVERKYELVRPSYFDQIDLFDTNPSVGTGKEDDDEGENLFASGSASLKTLAGRMHCKRLQDLPFKAGTFLTHEEMDASNDYCLNSDCVATLDLYDYLKEPLALREAMGEVYEDDFRSLSDAQMGERMIKIGVERLTGSRIGKTQFEGAYTFRYQVPDFVRFETPEMQEMLRVIAETDIQVTETGSVKFPEAFKKFKIEFDGTEYTLGIGGLHSKEKSRAVFSDAFYQLIDFDVGSQYPSIIIKLGMYPLLIGPHFQTVYSGIKTERMQFKTLSKQANDEESAAVFKQKSEGLKVGLNGPYGKLGSRYSALYAPHLMIGTTLTGQLTLLMFIEKCRSIGVVCVSANTDGVVLRVPRTVYAGMKEKNGKPTERLNPCPLADVIEWWEGLTSFEFEGAEYDAVYSRDVNFYLAIKPDGKVKRKGSIANHWDKKSPDYSVREMLKKNPNMTVIGDAILEFLTKGTPVEDFIRSYTDIRGFIRVIKAMGGGDWRGQYLGKTVRFYWSTDGDRIWYGKPHKSTGNRKTVQTSEGCRPMMTLPDDFTDLPADLDYDRYIEAAHEMLEKIGYTGQSKGLPPIVALYQALLVN